MRGRVPLEGRETLHGRDKFKLQIMTESQPEGADTTRDAMEEDLIEESAFEVEEIDQYSPRASAKSFTNVN